MTNNRTPVVNVNSSAQCFQPSKFCKPEACHNKLIIITRHFWVISPGSRLIASGGGGTTPLADKKFVKKNGKCNQYDLLLVLPKSSWGTFKIIISFKTPISSGGLSRDHYWKGGIQEIHDFQGFWSIFQRVFDISS